MSAKQNERQTTPAHINCQTARSDRLAGRSAGLHFTFGSAAGKWTLPTSSPPTGTYNYYVDSVQCPERTLYRRQHQQPPEVVLIISSDSVRISSVSSVRSTPDSRIHSFYLWRPSAFQRGSDPIMTYAGSFFLTDFFAILECIIF